METMQEGGGRLQNGPTAKMPNRLKLAQSDENDKVTSEKTAEMDPYRELELYLAKVNEEIGEIIESAPTTPLRIVEETRHPTQPEKLSSYANDSFTPKYLPATKSHGFARRQNSLTRGGEDIGEWSNSILAEFNSIIANEINELTKEKTRKEPARSDNDVRIVQYKELLNEFGISDSECSDREFNGEHDSLRDKSSFRDRRNGKLFVDDDRRCLLNSDYDEPHDRVIPDGTKSGSLPENLQNIIGKRGRFHTTETLSSDYDEPSNCLPIRLNQIDRITSSLPSKLERECVTKDTRSNPCHAPKTPVGLSTKTNEDTNVDALQAGSFRTAEEDPEEANAKLPPRQRTERKTSLPINLTNQKRRKAMRMQRLRRGADDQETMDPDYDDVFPNETGRSRSLDNHVPKSAPVTPTEEKKPPFSKLLRKRHTPVFHESSDDVILVSVSSLPDQDTLRLRNDRLHEAKNGKANSKETLTRKKRAISPLTLRSDVTAKRLSESDRDIRQISPVDLKKFSLTRTWGNDVAVNCDLSENNDVNGNCGTENGTLGKLEHADVKRIMEEQNTKTGSLPISLQSLLSRIRNGSGSCCPNSPPMDTLTCSDMATQTSPAISRSSSFTWVSDCDSPQAESQLDSQSLQDESTLDPASPQDTVDDDNRSSSSSQDLLQSMDEISSGSLSPDTTDRASPLESGIGTASPPRSTDRRLTKPSTPNKCHRKETWERIRRRPSKLNSRNDKNSQDVWVKRESVHTQTKQIDDQYSQDAVDSSSGLDDSLPRIRTPRPTNLPLCLSTTASSSLSSGELLETPPRAPSSPSAASLQLKPEPLTVEMGGKSSSAPLLENNNAKTANGKVPSLQQQPRSQSERHLSGMSSEDCRASSTTSSGNIDHTRNSSGRRMSHFKEYKFFRSFSAKVENWPMRKAEALWRRMRERKIAALKLSRRASVCEPPHPPSHLHAYEDPPGNQWRIGNAHHEIVIRGPRGVPRPTEIEAQEACKWLRAAGFPQYAQMYEDYQFPIDVSGVAKDHPFLEADSLQSLFRRLHALNRCANMKLDTHHTHHSTSHGKSSGGGDESDEDTQCALSEKWTFEKKTRRWSRIGDVTAANVERLQAIAGQNAASEDDSIEDRLEAEEAEDTMLENLRYSSLPPGTVPEGDGTRFRRSGSERLRDGAKAFLRRVESLKSRRRKRQNRDGVVISGPQVLDVMSMQQKMKELNCVDVSPTEPAPVSFNELLSASPLQIPGSPVTLPASPYNLPPSPLANAPSPFGDDSSSYCSDGSQGGGPTPKPTRTKMNRARRFLHRGREDQGALSDSECQPTNWRHRYFRDANSNHAKVLEFVTIRSQSSKERSQNSTPSKNAPINTRGGSLNLGKESQRYRDKLAQDKEEKPASSKREDKMRKSFRRRGDDSHRDSKSLSKEVTVYREKSRSRSSELAGSQESGSTVASRDSEPEEESPRHKGTVVRWHSFQRGSLYPEPLDPLCPRAMASMSCGQLLVLRKLALLKLTACMERYCPTHRTGWNWELPKFIRKIKSPDYKDKTVFGVPLVLSLQRTGQALPKCIQIALRWLRANALDQVGIFRKSGVKSRIQKLKIMTETQGDNINFDGQQAFDVADLVKQYFRELPEALLTNKLSETFIAIFQHVPVELRPDAVQCVLLLLPDEHREALETLLDFLNHVASNSPYNQMTASNLAVCLAPSLFHFNHSNTNVTNRSSSVSPRRRKTVGIPDQRELSENKAAHDCLLYLVKMHRELFMVSSDMLTQCHFNYMEESIPVALEELGLELKQDWRGYLYACTTALLKEAREKSRGWVTINNPADNSVEMAYKKVGDGHPLRLWRVATEVEAPPNELLHRVLRERHIWDPQLLKYRLVTKLDTNVEVFQYATGNMSPLPARDYCVVRSWRNDLPKGTCVIVETSVQHPDAPVMLGGTRGIVLASRYLIEPCGSGKSRIMHLSRVDTKGRTPDWYNKSYGHIAALHLSKIRNSFKHTTDGPESKV